MHVPGKRHKQLIGLDDLTVCISDPNPQAFKQRCKFLITRGRIRCRYREAFERFCNLLHGGTRKLGNLIKARERFNSHTGSNRQIGKACTCTNHVMDFPRHRIQGERKASSLGKGLKAFA